MSDPETAGARIASPVEMWACSACGLHPDNTSRWCAVGCGRDYQNMLRIKVRGFEPAPSGDWVLRTDLDEMIRKLRTKGHIAVRFTDLRAGLDNLTHRKD